jgi:6-phosphogluconolactonase
MEDTETPLRFLPEEVLPGVLVCPENESVARAATRMFVEWVWQAIAREGTFRVALSGGSTPRAFYRTLADETYRRQVDWGKVHLFWGDERCVPPDDPESNYGLVRRELLIRVPIPPGNVHRMEADREDLGPAALAYEELLRAHLELDEHGLPSFDLIFLGLGLDGHTASLFPGAHGLRSTSRWVSTPLAPHLGTRRMTLTLPVLNAARRVLFLVEGAEKAAILHTVLEEEVDPPLPAQLVTPTNGQRWFLVDRAAAALLPRQRALAEPQEQEAGEQPRRTGEDR